MTGSEWIALAGLVVAGLSIGKDFALAKSKAKADEDLKRYEVEFLEKRRSFAALAVALRKIAMHAAELNRPSLGAGYQMPQLFDEEVAASVELWPFLTPSDHDWLTDRLEAIETYAHEFAKRGSTLKYEDLRQKIWDLRRELFVKLFPERTKAAT
jgi:hypothetical protein